MEVMLNEEQTAHLKQYIYTVATSGIEEARRHTGLDKPFLKQKQMAVWLDVSVVTLNKWERNGLPTIHIEGIKLYSKDEVSKWVLSHQK
ncbi:hypothetical protein [Brochothrix thermosphacta]|uniref:hypothetical protein n=1 Tax=Brochothrix thermosphacta TaxID=2756 RepID=UPI0009BF985A|nr:hypothetical protein [Brochothrix thermosphacta]